MVLKLTMLLVCGILDDGRLKSVAYSSYGKNYFCHLDTNVKFSSVVIPNFDKVKNIAVECSKIFPQFRLISWDIALDEKDNPLLIEANLRYGELDFHQLNNGPIFGKDTKEILNEVFDKE